MGTVFWDPACATHPAAPSGYNRGEWRKLQSRVPSGTGDAGAGASAGGGGTRRAFTAITLLA